MALEMNRSAFIFLDIDGVLHRLDQSENDFYRVPVLKEFLSVLKTHDCDYRLVLSSSWRLSVSLSEISEKMGIPLDDRTGDEIYIPAFKDDEKGLSHNSRFLEIQKYVQKHAIDWKDVLVLDDLPALFTYPIGHNQFYGDGDKAYIPLLDDQEWKDSLIDIPEGILRASQQICIVNGLEEKDIPRMLQILGIE